MVGRNEKQEQLRPAYYNCCKYVGFMAPSSVINHLLTVGAFSSSFHIYIHLHIILRETRVNIMSHQRAVEFLGNTSCSRVKVGSRPRPGTTANNFRRGRSNWRAKWTTVEFVEMRGQYSIYNSVTSGNGSWLTLCLTTRSVYEGKEVKQCW